MVAGAAAGENVDIRGAGKAFVMPSTVPGSAMYQLNAIDDGM